MEAPRGHARLVESAGSPDRHLWQGDRGLSQVPELPLWRHAPLSHPGGVLGARHVASRTAAFRPLETVGFPLLPALRAILLSTTIHISGLHPAACLLAPSSFVLPLLGVPVEFAPDPLARRWWGLSRIGSHPRGNSTQFHENSLNPKVSGFPWRDQCRVRWGPAEAAVCRQLAHTLSPLGLCPEP